MEGSFVDSSLADIAVFAPLGFELGFTCGFIITVGLCPALTAAALAFT